MKNYTAKGGRSEEIPLEPEPYIMEDNGPEILKKESVETRKELISTTMQWRTDEEKLKCLGMEQQREDMPR